MKITAITTFIVPPRWCFVRVDTDAGISGWGEPIVEGRAHTVAAAVDELADYLIGKDPRHIQDHWSVLYRAGFYRGGPVLMSALAGIDHALWDIHGKALGVPVHVLLGGPVRDKIRVYSWIGGDRPSDTADAARAAVARGFSAVKMNGTEELQYVDSHAKVDRMLANVQAVREAVGPDIGLGVDFHGRVHKPMAKVLMRELAPYNLMFIAAGLLLHWRPRRFVRAVAEAVPATSGVLIQFPFYAVIFGMIVGTGISPWLADLFARVTTHGTYPLLVALYSAILGTFVPSGGSKWIIEAPYVLQAANLHQVHLGWVVQIYNAAEALPNLVNPFWMLPLLGLLRLKARDLVGYTVLQMMLHVPIVFFLCWLFALYMVYVQPMK